MYLLLSKTQEIDIEPNTTQLNASYPKLKYKTDTS